MKRLTFHAMDHFSVQGQIELYGLYILKKDNNKKLLTKYGKYVSIYKLSMILEQFSKFTTLLKFFESACIQEVVTELDQVDLLGSIIWPILILCAVELSMYLSAVPSLFQVEMSLHVC